jgi:hypothetical protein
MNVSIVLLAVVWGLKDEHYLEWTRLLELNLITINALAIGMLNLMFFLKI